MWSHAPLRVHDPDAPPPERTLGSLLDDAAADAAVTDGHFRVLWAIGRLAPIHGDHPPVDLIAKRARKAIRSTYVAIRVLASHGFLLTAKDANGDYSRIVLNTSGTSRYREECRREVEKDRERRARGRSAAKPEVKAAHVAAQSPPESAHVAAQCTAESAPLRAPSRAGVSNGSVSNGSETEFNPSPVAPMATETVVSISPEERAALEARVRRNPRDLVARMQLRALDDPPVETPRASTIRPSPGQGIPSSARLAEESADQLLGRFDGRPVAEAAWSIAESLGVRWGDSKPETLGFWSDVMPRISRPRLRELLVDCFLPKSKKKARVFSAGLANAVREERAQKTGPGEHSAKSPRDRPNRYPGPMSNSTREVIP